MILSEQDWACEVCGASGSVPLGALDTVGQVLDLLSADHVGKSRSCHANTLRLRLRNPSIVSAAEWERIVEKVKEQAKRRLA